MSDAKQEVFAALADPNRRTIIEILIDDGAKTATQLADDLPISRQGVSKHLNILAGAGLVTVVQRGREKFYYLTPEPMEETAVWLAAIAARWDKRLHKLQDLLEPGQESS
jgi:DNA-binding transcriptional ArsR family regulator